ncbi:glycosyl hydrolase [Cerasicoccus arenae]|uniref:GH26 domain-containing protein n=1 Tax=Cerasicoccus arenae TaxID=424488 RepID=A0A8J3DFB8_9BACT|nr:glycosyl hydrolase [Cerasicoccus arenae]MBK1859860.1 hypothetical protein [Cerasicoccus arenae]GHC13417.1 hypothetical protein GCM10007047_33470 [Cerasicoccus arenae]
MPNTLRWPLMAALTLTAGLCLNIHADPVPPSDNTEVPYMGVYEWGFTQGTNINRHEFAASWLARSNLWTETFTATNTWTDISGPGWLLDPVAWWLEQHDQRVCVLSVAMLPGPWDGSGPTSGPGAGSPVSLATGATGAYNSYFTTLAQNLVARNMVDNTIIRLGWEFNGGWYTWRADSASKAANFVAYWQEIVTAMRSVPGAADLKFCWNGINVWMSYPLEDAWPGDDYVDYVGVDLYDQSWASNTYPYPDGATPEQILARQQNAWTSYSSTYDYGLAWWRNFAAAHNKPLSIPEWGLCDRSDGHGGQDNAYYIQQMHDFIQDPANNVAFHVYFDVQAPDGGHQVTPYNGFITSFPDAAVLYRELFAYLPWDAYEIGNTGLAGDSTPLASGDATVAGAGSGYSDGATTDAFHLMGKPLTGNNEILLRIDSATGSGTAQSGIMIRDGATANASYAAVYLSNGYCSFQSRSSTSTAAKRSQITANVSAPQWLALRRRGDQVLAYHSPDGTSWSYAGSANVQLSSEAIYGIAVSSGSTTVLNTVAVSSIDQPISVILDNTASSGVTKVGTWSASTSSPGFRQTDYLHDGNSGKGSKSVTFSPSLPSAGIYRVYLNWTDSTIRASNVPVTVTHLNGSTQLTIDQQQPGQWVDLGLYTFASGSTGSVTISNAGTSSYVVADAVEFVASAPDIIVLDSTANTGVVLTGAWSSSTAMPGYYGVNYLHDNNVNKGAKSVTYTPNIPSEGLYRVYLNWGYGYANRASNVPFDVTDADGLQGYAINQQVDGYWVWLGDHYFIAGTSGTLQLGTAGTNGYVLADGVMLEAITQMPAQ